MTPCASQLEAWRTAQTTAKPVTAPEPARAEAQPEAVVAPPEPVAKFAPPPAPMSRPIAAPVPLPNLRPHLSLHQPLLPSRWRDPVAPVRCASGLRTAQARRHGSTRGQCCNRGGSQQQGSRDHHRQTVRPHGGAQARPRRNRRALSEGPQLPAAVGRPRRGERARQGRRSNISAPSTPTGSIRKTTGCRSSTSAAPRSRHKPS